MIRRPILYLLFTATTIIGGGFSAAILADPAGDPAKGQELSQTCQGCHGPDGNSLSEEWPNLAEQNVDYISKQLMNFKSGARKDPTMTSMAATVNDEDIKHIAAYFNSQKINRAAISKEEFDSQTLNVGKKIYKGGNLYTGVPACAGCHGATGDGNGPAKFPLLDGQRIAYIAKQLKAFATGTRSNDPHTIMQNIASRLSDKEITAVATYIRSLAQQSDVANKD